MNCCVTLACNQFSVHESREDNFVQYFLTLRKEHWNNLQYACTQETQSSLFKSAEAWFMIIEQVCSLLFVNTIQHDESIVDCLKNAFVVTKMMLSFVLERLTAIHVKKNTAAGVI